MAKGKGSHFWEKTKKNKNKNRKKADTEMKTKHNKQCMSFETKWY